MEDTLLIGDYIFSNNRYYNKNQIQRDDLIIYNFSETKKQTIKRVIGLPGDKIEIINKEVYLNDEFIDQPYVKNIDESIIPSNNGRIFWDTKFLGSRDNFGPITVPDNHYFVLGDNRDVSADSRFNGFIHRDKIVGKPVYVIFSYGEYPIQNLKEYSDLYKLNKLKGIRWSRIGSSIE